MGNYSVGEGNVIMNHLEKAARGEEKDWLQNRIEWKTLVRSRLIVFSRLASSIVQYPTLQPRLLKVLLFYFILVFVLFLLLLCRVVSYEILKL
jgi:hypothetical protein